MIDLNLALTSAIVTPQHIHQPRASLQRDASFSLTPSQHKNQQHKQPKGEKDETLKKKEEKNEARQEISQRTMTGCCDAERIFRNTHSQRR